MSRKMCKHDEKGAQSNMPKPIYNPRPKRTKRARNSLTNRLDSRPNQLEKFKFQTLNLAYQIID